MKTFSKRIMLTGLIIVGLFIVAIFAQTSASATTVTTPYMALKSKSTTVTTNGKYALYTKPGTVQGAKLVASKNKMKNFGTFTKKDVANANSNDAAKYRGSAYYMYAYGYKVTNTGAVYYRVVTMNGKYRGYVYGGKMINQFAGGVKKTNTTTTVPSDIASPVGILNSGVLWNVIPYTKYPTKKLGVMRAIGTTIPHLAKFKIIAAVKRNREGDMYYHLVSIDNNKLNGWAGAQVAPYDDILSDWEPAPMM